MKRLFLALSAFAILSLFSSCASTEAMPEETVLVEEVEADATSGATDATSGATEASGEY